MTDSSNYRPTILCVVPTHGRNDLLEGALASIEAQTVRPTRVRVVDDLQDPATRRLVETWGRDQSFVVQYVSLSPSAPSAGTSRNAGAEGSQEDILAFLDDDDVWAPTFLERCLAALDSAKSSVAVAWTAHVRGQQRERGLQIRDGLLVSDVLAENPGVTGSNLAIKREAFEAIGGFDESLVVSNDLDFFVRLLIAGGSYVAVHDELVDQVAHDQGQLTTPSERRANGLAAYLRRYSSLMTISQRRELKRSIHAVRRHISRSGTLRFYHTMAQAVYSSPAKLLTSMRRAVTGRRSIYTRSSDQGKSMRVIHLGVVGDVPGGMAQVINRYLSWDFDHMQVRAIPTTRGARDPFAPLFTLAALARITVTRRRRQSVAVVHLSERGSFVREGLVLLFARAVGFSTVAHLHGAEFVSFAVKHPRICRYVLQRAHHVAVLTRQTRATVERLVGSSTPTTIVPNGVDVPESPATKDQHIVTFGGEVGSRKGADLLAAAWSSIASDYPTWQLRIAGPDGGQAALFADLPRCQYLGALPHAELTELLRETQIAVLPSRNEALPMFILEAMAQGCVVVAADVGEIGDLVHEANGALMKESNQESLLAALRSILDLPAEKLRTLGLASHRIAESQYSERAVKSILAEMWRTALDTRRA
ncbi:glycosyltransferase [Microbacterium thalli]|uniref:D-inositol 3-phosphate glycosyltransferase n=1 Tax=Microbacterium thalli TaxID=3027921 RepID=A0ABT5SL02_9MICO|nr:glycosyltransferase [Microbacterium thalli]MDD7963508.1 glycosyltransferase [Microbacterium thalli]